MCLNGPEFKGINMVIEKRRNTFFKTYVRNSGG